METSIRIELSQVVDGDLGRLAKLLTSPEAWSLWPGAPFTFAVAGATQPLRLYIGPTPSGVGSVLYEVAEVPGESIRLRTLPTGRQEFTLSARAGRRGTAKASVQVRERVPRKHEVGYEIRRRKEIKSWLSEVRSVIEGRTPWPRADMGLELQERCKARPPMDDADSTSAAPTWAWSCRRDARRGRRWTTRTPRLPQP